MLTQQEKEKMRQEALRIKNEANLRPIESKRSGDDPWASYDAFRKQKQDTAKVEKPQEEKDFKEKVTGFFGGVGQSIMGTIRGASSLGEKYLFDPAARAILPKSLEGHFEKDQPTSAEQTISKESVTPQTSEEEAGKLVGDIGQFFLPIPGVGKGGLVTRVLTEAGFSFGLTAVQQGEINEAATEAGIIGGAFGGAGKVAEKALLPMKKFLAQKIPARLVNSVIKPISNAFSFGKDPGRGVATEGIVGNTRGSLLKNITTKADEINKEVQQKLSSVKGVEVDIKPAIDIIDGYIDDAVNMGERTLANRLEDVKNGLTQQFKRVGRDLEVVGEKPLILSPLEANKVKQDIGKSAKWTNQAFDDEVNAVRVQVYRAINDMIDDAVPGVKSLNKRLADLITAEKSLDRTIKIIERQNIFSIPGVALGSAVGLGSLATGQGGVESVVNGLLAAAGRRAVESPAVKTRIAKQLAKLSPEELGVISKILPTIRNIILGVKSDNAQEEE